MKAAQNDLLGVSSCFFAVLTACSDYGLFSSCTVCVFTFIGFDVCKDFVFSSQSKTIVFKNIPPFTFISKFHIGVHLIVNQ